MTALAFLEERIDDDVAFGMGCTATVPGRTKLYGATGRLTQNYAAAFPIHRYDLSHGIKTVEQFQAILDLWYVVHFGPYMGFLLRDWRDYQLDQTNSRLTLITGAIYQINRVHAYGAVEFLRPIYKPEAGLVVFRDRAGTITSASVTTDTTNGQVTISGHAGGDNYTCEGNFNIPVTFSDDEWNADLDSSVDHFLAVAGSIKLEEIRL